eukprot:20535-Heterococcus_DN1.PRE.1
MSSVFKCVITSFTHLVTLLVSNRVSSVHLSIQVFKGHISGSTCWLLKSVAYTRQCTAVQHCVCVYTIKVTASNNGDPTSSETIPVAST